MTQKKNYVIAGATSALGKRLSNVISNDDETNKCLMLSRSNDDDLLSICNNNIKYIPGIDLTTLCTNDNISEICSEFFDGPFVLIHCAGDFWTHMPFLEFDVSRAKKMMESHYLTLYATLQSVLPIMINKGGGKIVAFSFNSSNDNFPFILPYNAAKAAVEATIKCIAHEYAQENISANILALASLKTDASKKSRPFGDFENYLDLDELSRVVLEITSLSRNLVNASVINCYKFSESYYNQGYFERIKHIKQ